MYVLTLSAWCYVRIYSNKSNDARNIYPEIVGYEVWIFAIFLILPVINIATFCGVQYKVGWLVCCVAIYIPVKST